MGRLGLFQKGAEVEAHKYRKVEDREELPEVAMRSVAASSERAPNFPTRIFEIQPRSPTPYDWHAWDMRSSCSFWQGEVGSARAKRQFSEGGAILVAPNGQHCFANTGDDPLRFF